GLVDVGEHELKGLRRQETLYLVTAPGLDAPTSLQRQPDGSVGQRNSLVGRDEVLALLEEALGRPGLVTVVGPGGIGKTRVLHAVTGRVGDQFSRTWVVGLVGVRDRPGVSCRRRCCLTVPARPIYRIFNQATSQHRSCRRWGHVGSCWLSTTASTSQMRFLRF